MNKVTTKQNLQRIQEKLKDKNFKKEFNSLFKDYIDIRNTDKNAHYYAILKLLQDNVGMDKAEAEEFFKSLRVKNAKLIEEVQKIQREQQKLDEKWREERIKLLMNPLDIKSLVSIVLTTINEIMKKFEEIQKQLELRFANHIVAREKIKEIERLLNESKEKLENMEKNEDVMVLNSVVRNLEKVADGVQNVAVDNVVNNIGNDIEVEVGKEDVDKSIEGQEGKEKKRATTGAGNKRKNFRRT